jgi:hypothetical protein
MLAVMSSGCVQAYDGPVGSDGDHCSDSDDYSRYSGHIVEPKEGQTVPTTFTVDMTWDQPGIPDRYMTFHQIGMEWPDYGIQGTNPRYVGDVEDLEDYTLPGGLALVLEIGWYCEDGNDGSDVSLARVHFFTQD